MASKPLKGRKLKTTNAGGRMTKRKTVKGKRGSAEANLTLTPPTNDERGTRGPSKPPSRPRGGGPPGRGGPGRGGPPGGYRGRGPDRGRGPRGRDPLDRPIYLDPRETEGFPPRPTPLPGGPKPPPRPIGPRPIGGKPIGRPRPIGPNPPMPIMPGQFGTAPVGSTNMNAGGRKTRSAPPPPRKRY